MGQRHIGCLPRGDGEGNTDDAGLGVVEAGGLGIEGEQIRRCQLIQPAIQIGLGQDGFVAPGGRVSFRRRLGGGGASRVRGIQLPQPAIDFQVLQHGAQGGNVHGHARQFGRRQRQLQIAADGRQLSGQRNLLQAGPQVFPDLARDAVGLLDQRVQRAVLLQPFRRCLRADLGDAGDVVRGIADQGQIVDDTLRRYAELGDDAIMVQPRVEHGVFQRDALVHQLRHVLVAGGNDHAETLGGGPQRQGADDIVGLDAAFDQQRQAHGADDGMQRFDLRL